MTVPVLPVDHGMEITFTCPADHINQGGYKATCQQGVLVPATAPPLCSIREFVVLTCTLPASCLHRYKSVIECIGYNKLKINLIKIRNRGIVTCHDTV